MARRNMPTDAELDNLIKSARDNQSLTDEQVQSLIARGFMVVLPACQTKALTAHGRRCAQRAVDADQRMASRDRPVGR